jgi:hypothetical protein
VNSGQAHTCEPLNIYRYKLPRYAEAGVTKYVAFLEVLDLNFGLRYVSCIRVYIVSLICSR